MMVFEWRENKDYGNIAWAAVDYPNFEPIPDIAHDVIDHMPGCLKHGAYFDELLALGAAYRRIFESAGDSPIKPEQDLFGDLFNILLDDQKEYSTKRILALDTAHDLFLYLSEDVPELQQKFLDYATIENENFEIPLWFDFKQALAWIAKGWDSSVSRFPNHDPWEIQEAFKDLNEKAREIKGYFEGQRLTVHFCNKTLEFKLLIQEL